MKKGQTYEGVVKSISFPNKGLVETKVFRLKKNEQEITPEMILGNWPEKNGINMSQDVEETIEKAIVKGSFPGQKIKYYVNKKKGGKCEGRIEEILEKSPLEDAKPACPHFGACGGCSYQSLSYENQLKLKYEMVLDLIKPVLKTDDTVFEGIVPSPSKWEYRNKMEFTFGDAYKGGPLELGLHKKGSNYDVVPLEACKIVDDDYNKILNTVLGHFRDLNVPYYHTMSHEGVLRHLLVRRSKTTGEISVNLVTTSQYRGYMSGFNAEEGGKIEESELALAELKEKLLTLDKGLNGNIVGITHIINDALGDVVKCDEMRIIHGRDYIMEEILGLKFKVSTFSFFQTNSLGAERLYEKARDFVRESVGGDLEALKGKTMFDLYSGTGTIAQMMSPVVGKVVGVEIVEDAVEAAKENAALNGLKNCEFIAGDVLKVIDEIKDKPDYIILDPPRDGINPKALEKIIDFGVEKMVYISCKPTSLARDLVLLQERGYKVEKMACVDMFPQTVHVESCVLLRRVSNTRERMITLDVEMEDYYRLKDETEKA